MFTYFFICRQVWSNFLWRKNLIWIISLQNIWFFSLNIYALHIILDMSAGSQEPLVPLHPFTHPAWIKISYPPVSPLLFFLKHVFPSLSPTATHSGVSKYVVHRSDFSILQVREFDEARQSAVLFFLTRIAIRGAHATSRGGVQSDCGRDSEPAFGWRGFSRWLMQAREMQTCEGKAPLLNKPNEFPGWTRWIAHKAKTDSWGSRRRPITYYLLVYFNY